MATTAVSSNGFDFFVLDENGLSVLNEEGLKQKAREEVTNFVNGRKPFIRATIETAATQLTGTILPIAGQMGKALVTTQAPAAAPFVNPAIDVSVGVVVTLGPALSAPHYDASTEKTAEIVKGGAIVVADQSIHSLGQSLNNRNLVSLD